MTSSTPPRPSSATPTPLTSPTPTRLRTMVTGKIHRATVTGADLHYVGSVTVDLDLLEAADILPGEKVDIVNITNGNRLATYVIPGEPGAGEIKLNGAAAHLCSAGDLVILMCYAQLDDATARTYEPNIVFVDEHNKILEEGSDPGQVPDNPHHLTASGISFDEARRSSADQHGAQPPSGTGLRPDARTPISRGTAPVGAPSVGAPPAGAPPAGALPAATTPARSEE